MSRRAPANWRRLREQGFERAGGRCEVSGRPLDFDTFDLHHRRNKGMGGTTRPDTDTLPNLLAVDPIAHNGGPGSVHSDRSTLSGPRGWLVSKLSTAPLTTVPALVVVGPGFRQWVTLTEDGGREPLSRALSHWEVSVGAGACWPPAPAVVVALGDLRAGVAPPSGRVWGKVGRGWGETEAQWSDADLRRLREGRWPEPERPPTD